MMKCCFICGGDLSEGLAEPYSRCLACGHEISLNPDTASRFLLNDKLDEASVRKKDLLTRFKTGVLRRFAVAVPGGGGLLDIGSSNGKFLWHNGAGYEKAIGVEVTPAAVDFSTRILELEIVTSINQVQARIDVATAWHSLEHVPPDELSQMLATLSKLCANGALFIVSVPNGASRHYAWFRRDWAFFDSRNHWHNFTERSLDLLLSKFGFQRIDGVYSTPYNVFSAIQSLLNLFTGQHNYLYLKLKRNTTPQAARPAASPAGQFLKNLFALPATLVSGLSLSIVEACLPRSNQSGLTCIYKKIERHPALKPWEEETP
jgi:hypothetical protein